MTTYQQRLAQPAPRMGLTKGIFYEDMATERRKIEDDIRNYECKSLTEKQISARINEQLQGDAARRKTNEMLLPEWRSKLDWNKLLGTKLFNKHA